MNKGKGEKGEKEEGCKGKETGREAGWKRIYFLFLFLSFFIILVLVFIVRDVELIK